MNYFDSDMSNQYKYGSILYLEDGNLYLRLWTMSHNLCYQMRADDNSSTCTFMTGKSVVLMEHLKQ
jgi:hypothetical protein